MSVPFSENGGFVASNFFLFMPTSSPDGSQSYIGIFDVSNFNDPTDGRLYTYRQEDIIVGRVPTVRRIILVYRDTGVLSVTVTVQGTDDNGQKVSQSVKVQIGTTSASLQLLTKFVDIELTAFRPQPLLSQNAGDGPLDIVSLTMIGSVEEVTL